MVTASLQVAKPILCLSPSVVFLHVSFGQPLLLFSLYLDCQVRDMHGFLTFADEKDFQLILFHYLRKIVVT